MTDLFVGHVFVGIDIGTSGVRARAVDEAGRSLASSAVPLSRVFAPGAGEGGVDAETWWSAARDALVTLLAKIDPAAVRAVAVDGTSGSVVILDRDLTPLTPGLLYDAKGFDDEARHIDPHAPPGSPARGSGSALARALRLQSLAPGAAHLAHQADFVVARLMGRGGLSDESNALKTGYDARERRWPDWIAATGLRTSLLPEARPVGTPLGPVGADAIERFGLRPDTVVVAGASDGTAGFLAAGETTLGTAVTSLGTTLTLKIASSRPVEDAARGIYSHRVGDTWLPGGASNTGGGALLLRFTPERMSALSKRIDPAWEPAFEAYPLPCPGERFPVNDPDLAPVMDPPEPIDEARHLHALFHAIARIEAEGYRALADLGAPYPTHVMSVGGGAANPVWTAMREAMLGVPVRQAEADPALGMALLARSGWLT